MRLLIYSGDLLTALKLENEMLALGREVKVAAAEDEFSRLLSEFDPTHILLGTTKFGAASAIVAKRGSTAKVGRIK